MLPKINPIFDKPPGNLCLHEPVAMLNKNKEIVVNQHKFEIYAIEYKCKHCDEIQQNKK